MEKCGDEAKQIIEYRCNGVGLSGVEMAGGKVLEVNVVENNGVEGSSIEQRLKINHPFDNFELTW